MKSEGILNKGTVTLSRLGSCVQSVLGEGLPGMPSDLGGIGVIWGGLSIPEVPRLSPLQGSSRCRSYRSVAMQSMRMPLTRCVWCPMTWEDNWRECGISQKVG